MRKLPPRAQRYDAPLARLGLVVAAALTLASCISTTATSTQTANVANAQASLPASPTIAFESIDGPPHQVFERLVDALDSEAKLRQVAVVSRQDSAAYRIRTYLAAIVHGSKTSIAWVWDVYDRDQERLLRISGEEKVTGSDRDAWTLADGATLQRIAQAGLTGLASLIGANAGRDAPAPPRSEKTASPAVADANSSMTIANAQASMMAQ